MKKLSGDKMADLVGKSAAISPTLHNRFEKAAETLSNGLPFKPTVGPAEDKAKAEIYMDEKGRKSYFLRIPVEDIDHNPFNARSIYVPHKIEDLAKSIATEGQLVPGIGTFKDGRCICIAGNYRLKAIKAAGKTHMTFMIHEDLTDQEMYQLSYKENDERTDQTVLDNALVWNDLINNGTYKDDVSIAEAIGMSKSNVSKTMSILKLPVDAIDYIKESPEDYPLSSLYELYQLSQVAPLEVTLEFCRKIRDGEASRTDCQKEREKYNSQKTRKTKENSRHFKIHMGGAQVGVLKEWDSGKVVLDITCATDSERQDLVNKLKTLLNLEVAS